jgi:hypothetical protein
MEVFYMAITVGKVVGVALAGLVIGAGAGIAAFPRHVDVEVIKEVPKEVIKEVPGPTQFVDKIVEVPGPTVTKEVPVEVKVDNGNLQSVLKFIWDNNGEVSLLTEDLKEKDIALIADRVVFINDLKSMAVSEVEKNLFDELDNKQVALIGGGNLDLNDKDMEKLRVKDDADQVLIEDVSFEDGDGKANVFGSFYQDDYKFNFEARVKFIDSDVDDLTIVSVENVN